MTFPAAERVLSEFGGLTFGWAPEYVSMDPSRVCDVTDVIKTFEKVTSKLFYPLGVDVVQDTFFLLIDQDGVIYELGYAYDIKQDTEEYVLETFAPRWDIAIAVLLDRSASCHFSKSELLRMGLFEKQWVVDAKGF